MSGRLEGVSRRCARRRQDLRDAAGRASAQGRGRRRRHRPRRDARARRDRRARSRGSKCCRAAWSNIAAAPSPNSTSTRRSRASPQLIVVDELAHTNAPESRHPKRWQDVQELLAAGIDVWTALNIQHLESLADVVSRITGVVVRETVPDRVLQEATDVVLVDITPDELIQRLQRRQGLCARDGAARDPELLHPRQSDRAARARACAAPPTGSTTRWSTTCARRRSRARGAPPSACSPASAPDEVSERVVRRAAQLATSPQRRLDGGLHRAGRPGGRRQEGEPDRQDLRSRRAARRRHDAAPGQRLSRRKSCASRGART